MKQMQITSPWKGDGRAVREPDITENRAQDSDERGTSRGLINDLLSANNGLFEIDLASGAEPQRIGLVRLTKEDDALTSNWDPSDHSVSPGDINQPVTEGSGWLNPPFSLGKEFGEKADRELQRGSLEYLLFLCSAQSVSDNWYQKYIVPNAEYVCFPDGRLEFTNTGSNPQIPCIITSLGDTPSQIVSLFHERGACLEVKEQTSVQEQLFNFIENSEHPSEGEPELISTSYRSGEPILNNVGRGDRLELLLREDVHGYEAIEADDQTLEVEVITWTEKDDRWEVIGNLNRGEGPFDADTFFIIYINKEGASSFTVSHQVGDRGWVPTPVKDIRTITNQIDWNAG
jgi:hypothetical protein